MSNETVSFKVGDKVQKKQLVTFEPKDETVYKVVSIEKKYLPIGSGFIGSDGELVMSKKFLMLATLSDGSVLNLQNLIKV